MANYFNQLSLREQLHQLAQCRFMESSEFEEGITALKGKNIVIQVWGLPSGKFLEEMNKEENKGKYQLRGCCVSGDDPDYCCNDCGEEF